MFLSVLILLQNSLPCTENFYRYQKNFEKYISTEGTTPENSTDASRPASGGKSKLIASPRVMTNTNSPMNSLSKQLGINFNPSGTKNMLASAANKIQGGTAS